MPQNPLGATTLPSKVRVSAIRNSNFSVSAPARLNEKTKKTHHGAQGKKKKDASMRYIKEMCLHATGKFLQLFA